MTSPDAVTAKLDELLALVESARSMPMSASCVLNRGETVALIDQARTLLPQALQKASSLLADRDAVIAEGRIEAERIIAAAHEERAALVSEHEVAREAAVEADRLERAAAARSESMAAEVDDYVDSKLANFEVVLTKTLQAVDRGREKLRGRIASDDLRTLGDDADSPPLPQ